MTIAALLGLGPGFTGPAHAGNPVDKYELTRRVTEAARMLAGNPKFKGLSNAQREKAVEFITGNMIFVLGHEAGHAVIREMGIPVVGREEDAADIFATLMALMCTDAFADRVLANAALGWFFSDRRDRREQRGRRDESAEAKYYDAHGMDLQRAYSVVCLMVGSNMGKFGAVADAARLPAERQQTCQDDYLNASWSWEQVLKALFAQSGPAEDGDQHRLRSGQRKIRTHVEISRHIQLLEAMAYNLSDRFVWREPISLEMQTCGEPNARWEWRSKKVVICYEMADEFAELYRKYGRSMAFTLDQRVSEVTPRGENGQKQKALRESGGQKQKSLRAKRPVR